MGCNCGPTPSSTPVQLSAPMLSLLQPLTSLAPGVLPMQPAPAPTNPDFLIGSGLGLVVGALVAWWLFRGHK